LSNIYNGNSKPDLAFFDGDIQTWTYAVAFGELKPDLPGKLSEAIGQLVDRFLNARKHQLGRPKYAGFVASLSYIQFCEFDGRALTKFRELSFDFSPTNEGLLHLTAFLLSELTQLGYVPPVVPIRGTSFQGDFTLSDFRAINSRATRSKVYVATRNHVSNFTDKVVVKVVPNETTEYANLLKLAECNVQNVSRLLGGSQIEFDRYYCLLSTIIFNKYSQK
jgi:hypothetical protein